MPNITPRPPRPAGYRLYDCESRAFLGPRETCGQAWKRLSRITNRRRDRRTNWLRLIAHVVPVNEWGKLTTAAGRSQVSAIRRNLHLGRAR